MTAFFISHMPCHAIGNLRKEVSTKLWYSTMGRSATHRLSSFSDVARACAHAPMFFTAVSKRDAVSQDVRFLLTKVMYSIDNKRLRCYTALIFRRPASQGKHWVKRILYGSVRKRASLVLACWILARTLIYRPLCKESTICYILFSFTVDFDDLSKVNWNFILFFFIKIKIIV